MPVSAPGEGGRYRQDGAVAVDDTVTEVKRVAATCLCGAALDTTQGGSGRARARLGTGSADAPKRLKEAKRQRGSDPWESGGGVSEAESRRCE